MAVSPLPFTVAVRFLKLRLIRRLPTSGASRSVGISRCPVGSHTPLPPEPSATSEFFVSSVSSFRNKWVGFSYNTSLHYIFVITESNSPKYNHYFSDRLWVLDNITLLLVDDLSHVSVSIGFYSKVHMSGIYRCSYLSWWVMCFLTISSGNS